MATEQMAIFQFGNYYWMSMEVSNLVTIVSNWVYNLLKGLITYLYRGYNPVTKYHGHPSMHLQIVHVPA